MPTMKQLCPEQAEVSLDQLGLDSTSHLIVRYGSQWNLVRSDSTQQTIVSVPDTIFAGISPDQRWFAYHVEGVNGLDSELWVSSTDGKVQSMAAKYAVTAPSIFYEWVNNETLIGFIGSFGERITATRLNPFTQETLQITQITVTSGTTSYTFSPDASQVIYSEFPVSWMLYDYQTKTKRPVLPWLETSGENPPSPLIRWTANGISVTSLHAKDLRIVTNLPLAELERSISPLQTVVLPDHSKSSAQRIEWWSSDSRYLGVSLVFGGKDRYDVTGLPKAFYILDTYEWVTYAYCLPEDLMPTRIHASLDERFIAWTVVSNNTLQGVAVMELATGKRAFLPDVELLGWGEVNTETSP